jgi:predicted  nucleic acid-binding Zn-ribbon protein
MSDYNEDLLLAKRNINALNEGLKHVERMRTEDSKRVEALMGTITQLQQQVQKLVLDVAVLRVKTLGTGPTT